MFTDMLSLFLDQFSNFFNFLSSMQIAGVSYVLILSAFLILCVLIRNFVSRG